MRKAQAEAGDIVLLYGDESEALTHPYLSRAWAERGDAIPPNPMATVVKDMQGRAMQIAKENAE